MDNPQFGGLGGALGKGVQLGRNGGMPGSGMRPGMGPVRIKKKNTLGNALGGMLMGIILIFGSPIALWFAESQHTAKDFASAEQVEATEVVDGYVTFQGEPTVTESAVCVDEMECLYSKLQEQVLTTNTSEVCGNVTQDEDTRILYKTVTECDEEGNCEQCYMVEQDTWEDVNVNEEYGVASIGDYTVQFGGGALMMDTSEKIIEYDEYTRDLWTYFPVPSELRVAGDAYSGSVAGAEKTYVLSQYDYAKTLEELQARDAAAKWMLRIVSFFMLFIGFASLMGLVTYFAHLFRVVPIIGPFVKEGTKFLVSLAAFLLAIVVWLVMWLVIMFVKNLVVALIVLAALGGGLVVWQKKKGDAPEDAPKAPEASEPTDPQKEA